MRKFLLLFIILLCPSIWAADGDILAVRIASAAAHNGWVAEIDIENLAVGGAYAFGLGTNNDPSAAKVVFSVRSDGYDNTGAATKIVRTIYGTQWVRKPYPDQADADESVVSTTLTVRVALSDFIYQPDDQITVDIGAGLYTQGTASAAATDLAVTNNSTLAYPKVIARWAWPAYEKVGSSFLLEALAFHGYAQNKMQVASVIFTVTDEHAHTVTSPPVTGMTISTRTGDVNPVLVYAATISTSTLTQGDVLTCNFAAYPWVGGADAVANSDLIANGGDGYAMPDERLGPLPLLNDKDGAYGEGYVVVDSTNGASVTTWDAGGKVYVYATQATAEAAYAGDNTLSINTVSRAIQCVKDFNTDTYTRSDPGGGTLLLATATNALPGSTISDQGAQKTWLTITRLSTVTRANAVISSGTNSNIQTRLFKVYDITLEGSSIGQLSGDVVDEVLWVDNCTINLTGNPGIYVWKLTYITRNSVTAVTNGFTGFGTFRAPAALVRGNTVSSASPGVGIRADLYCIVGNKNISPRRVMTGNTFGHQISDPAILAFNSFYNYNNDIITTTTGSATGIGVGWAIVQNILEQVADIPGVIFTLSFSDAATSNIVMMHNTTIGQRILYLYNDVGSSPISHTNEHFRNNLIDHYNIKSDTFTPANAGRTGNWAPFNSVAQLGNFKRASASFFGDFDGIYTKAQSGMLGFVDNAAFNYASGGGDGSGNGDYHLTETSSAIELVPAGKAVLPFDLEGTARRNLGGGAAGAYEYGSDPAGNTKRKSRNLLGLF